MIRMLGLLLIITMLGGCSAKTPEASKKGKPTIYAVNDPLRYFAERIGGDAIDVHCPVPTDEDPDFWKPSEEQIRAFQTADLILLNGAGYAKWTTNASLPLAKCVDTSSAFKARYIRIEHGVTHNHGPAGEHTHAGVANITWLDFKQAVEQAKAIKNALIIAAPTHQDAFEKRYLSLEADLLQLDADLEQITAKNKTQPVLGSHPVFQYLERRYGLKMKSVHWEADAVPSVENLNELAAILKNHPAKWMIWEDDPTEDAIAKLKAIGIQSVTFKTAGNRPEQGDFLQQMRQNITAIKAVYAP